MKKQSTTPQATTSDKRPSHRIYQIEDRGEGRKAFWREVGVAWENSDGSLNLKFAVLPLGDVQVRRYEDKKDESGAN